MSFASSGQSFLLRGDLGKGSGNHPPKRWPISRCGRYYRTVGGGTRTAGQGAPGPRPGPGAYQPKYPHDGFRKQQTTAECFGTKQARFGAL